MQSQQGTAAGGQARRARTELGKQSLASGAEVRV